MQESKRMRDFLEKTISEMVAIHTPTGQEGPLADYVCRRLEADGLAPQRDDQDNVWVEVGPADSPHLLHVNGHMDTVLPGDGWSTDPLVPTVDGDRLYGLGASDCRAGLAAMLWLASRVRPRVCVRFSFTVCEENGHPSKENGSLRMARDGGDWAITVESSCADGGPRISLGTQGHTKALVAFRGRAAHSARPETGENAVLAAARFCMQLDELNAAYPEQPLYGGVVARATVAPTMIDGGRLPNIIPDECRVTVSRRLAPGDTEDTFRGELDHLLSGVKATYELSGFGPCAVADPDGPLLAAARQALLDVTGRESYTFQRGRTDAVLYAAAGMDTLTLGPGWSGQAHSADEFVNLPAAAQCVRVLERAVNGLGPR